MTKLSDTQRSILANATQQEALLAEPPGKLPAAARQSVLRSLMAKGLLEEVLAPQEHVGLGWRQDENGAWIALRITEAGMAAIGVEPEAGAVTRAISPDAPDVERPCDERNGVDPSLAIGDLTDTSLDQPAPSGMALLPTTAQDGSLAASGPMPPSTSVEVGQGPQRPPVRQHGGNRAASLRMAAAAVG